MGAELFGIDVRDTIWRSVGLVRLDAATGRVLAKRNLVPDLWSIGLATIPAELVPRGQVLAMGRSQGTVRTRPRQRSRFGTAAGSWEMAAWTLSTLPIGVG